MKIFLRNIFWRYFFSWKNFPFGICIFSRNFLLRKVSFGKTFFSENSYSNGIFYREFWFENYFYRFLFSIKYYFWNFFDGILIGYFIYRKFFSVENLFSGKSLFGNYFFEIYFFKDIFLGQFVFGEIFVLKKFSFGHWFCFLCLINVLKAL